MSVAGVAVLTLLVDLCPMNGPRVGFSHSAKKCAFDAHTDGQVENTMWGIMLEFENALDGTFTSTSDGESQDQLDDLRSDPTEPVAHQDGPAEAAARMLELAAKTADQLVAGARTEAASLVTTAQAKADAILQASRNEAQQVEAELSRVRAEQTAELDRERAMALAGLAEERSAYEAKIATLRQMHSDYRSDMRGHLTQQLELLDSTMLEPPTTGTR